MLKLSANNADPFLLNIPFGHKQRQSKHEYDFGDQATVGSHVKRIGLGFHELQTERDFGAFLGEYEGRYGIGIWSFGATHFVGCETFDSLEELKKHWQLD